MDLFLLLWYLWEFSIIKLDIGVVITASHNPPSYNGYKLKGDFGGPLLPKDISIVESKIPKFNTVNIDSICLEHLENISMLQYVNLEDDYCNHANKILLI